MANAITSLITWLGGEFVGHDGFGNAYYRSRRAAADGRRRRWVIYAGGRDEASRVPPRHNAWLHYTVDDFPLPETAVAKPWIRPHMPNRTGTDAAWLPAGHSLAGERRAPATGDYDPWIPS